MEWLINYAFSKWQFNVAPPPPAGGGLHYARAHPLRFHHLTPNKTYIHVRFQQTFFLKFLFSFQFNHAPAELTFTSLKFIASSHE